MPNISGLGIGLLTSGAVMAYAGIKGIPVMTVVKDTLAGKDPGASAPVSAVTSDPASALGSSPTTGLNVNASGNGLRVCQLAQAQLGKPYVFDTPLSWLTVDPPNFDCSGLTGWTYHRIGVELAHYTGTQFAQLGHAPVTNAKPGDLLFYGSNRSGPNSYHVAINLGAGQLIEAPEPGKNVQIRGWSPGDGDLCQQVGVCP